MLAVLAFMYGIIFYNIGSNGASAFVLPTTSTSKTQMSCNLYAIE
jgi:hypothetical protein